MAKIPVTHNAPATDEGRPMRGVPGRGDLKPVNLHLWNMVVMQAKMRFNRYPSPAASNWVHKRYVENGGKFLASDDPRYKKLVAKQKSDDEKNTRHLDDKRKHRRHHGD